MYLISFGGNLGNREQNARDSLSRLQAFGRVGRQSRWMLTKPLRSPQFETHEQADYLNFVFEFETNLTPPELYSQVRIIEDFFGHERSRRWQSRAVDFDLLFYSRALEGTLGFQIGSALTFSSTDHSLRIPHAEVWQRNFLLQMIEFDLKIPIALLQPSARN